MVDHIKVSIAPEPTSTLALLEAAKARAQDATRELWAVDDALNRGDVPTVRPDGGRYTRMGRVAAVIDERNRLLNRCRAAGLPID